MKKWSYKVVNFGTNTTFMERELEELGAKGWEMVTCMDLPLGFHAIFKQEIPDPRSAVPEYLNEKIPDKFPEKPILE